MKAAAAFLLVLGCLAVSHGKSPVRPTRPPPHPLLPLTLPWKCTEAPRLSNALQVDAGMGMVVGTDIHKRAFFLSGRSWYRLGTVSLKHVSVGPSGTWGTDASDGVHKLVAGNFKQATGLTMQQVDAGGDGQLVGSSPSNNLGYCLRETSAVQYYGKGGIGWSSLSRRLKYISCGPLYGCWGVDTTSRAYVTGTMSPTTCGTTGWIPLSGAGWKMVEVGTDGSVFAVSIKGHLFQRIGITSSLPQGTDWILVPMCMTVQHVSYDMRQLWVVTTSRLLMTCVH